LSTDPSVCFSQSPFGFGPFPVEGGTLPCVPHPPGAGYGGVGYGPHDTKQGGTGFGLAGYGGSSHWPSSPVALDGGYGGDPYGLGPYGSTDAVGPQISSALSLSGYEIEVFFSEGMQPDDPALLDPASYTLIPVSGAAPATLTGVTVETVGSVDVTAGDTVAEVTSVILRHSGTTLGGTYTIRGDGPRDLGGNAMQASDVSILTRGEAPAHTITPSAGDKLLVTFEHPMLDPSAYPTTPADNARLTIEDPEEWAFEDDRGITPAYPVLLTAQSVEFPYQGDNTKAEVTTLGQTSILYRSRISPSFVSDWDSSQGDPTSLVSADYVSGLTGAITGVITGSVYRLAVDPGVGEVSLDFLDQTGNAADGATVRVDLDFNQVSFTAPVGDTGVFGLAYGFGALFEMRLVCGWDGPGGVPTLWVISGLAGISVKLTGYDWTAGSHTLSLVMNQKSDKAVWMFDELPVYSTDLINLVAPPVALAGGTAQVVVDQSALAGTLTLDTTRLHLTASSTVYSGAWNFLHEKTAQFTGSGALTKDWLKTFRGPLVKGHGDGTPASKQDVTVEVNGVEVAVNRVNPYTGRVEVSIPIPRMPPGQIDVAVDYQWMASPRMYMGGLNTKGVVLNKYDNPRGHHNPVGRGQENQDLPDHPKGSAPTQCYPYTILLGPPKGRPTPKLIGHRYMGFERAYSALLNSSTTLRLNNHPHRSQVAGFAHQTVAASVAFAGDTTPQAAPQAWELFGSDAGQQNPGAGTYTVIDTAGNPDPTGVEPVAVYHRDIDLSFPASMFVVGRFTVDTTPTPDGIWTGIGFGFHDDVKMYLAGALLVNELEHVGLLLNPDSPDLVGSWQIGPQTTLTVNAGQGACGAVTAEIPQDVAVGDRFQILEGTQAGAYTLTSVVHQTNGTSTLGVSPEFPEFHDLWGNKFPVAIFETKWSGKPATYRLTADPTQEVAVLQMSGDRTATLTEVDGTAPDLLPTWAETSLALPDEGVVLDGAKSNVASTHGKVFWGSLSRQASNQAEWSFFRYGVTPDASSVRGHVQTVSPDFTANLPDEDASYGWWRTGSFGQEMLSGGSLLMTAASDSAFPGGGFAYARSEPFLTPQAGVDLRTTYRQEFGSGGTSQVSLFNGQRMASLETILYAEDAGENRYVSMSAASFTGILNPSAQSWVEAGGVLDKTFGQQSFTTSGEGGWISYLDQQAIPLDTAADSGGRVMVLHIAVPTFTANVNGDTGIEMTAEVGIGTYRAVTLTLRGGVTPGVRAISGSTIVGQFDFDWTGGELHLYRCVVDASTDTVLVYVDDVLKATLDLTLFTSAGSGNTACSVGSFGTDLAGADDAAISATVVWRAVSVETSPLSTIKRALGVALRLPTSDYSAVSINDFVVPRTDGLSVPNSSTSAVLVEWDWRNNMEVRMVLDPLWGLSVLRPDLALPGGYTPEDAGTPGTGFHTRKVEPSAAWINVEYGNLPKDRRRFGSVLFGHLAQKVGQTRWAELSYEIYRHWKDDLKQPEGMVLNKFNIITSAELGEDKVMETVETETLDNRRLTLKPFHIYASRVYKVVDSGLIEPILTDEMWDFDTGSQTLTLTPDSEGNPRTFSADHAKVTVLFVPGKPVTETYLKSQELLQSLTRLNEGTPAYPKSQVAQTEKRVAVANDLRELDDPDAVLAANVLADADRFLGHGVPGNGDLDTYYEQMSFFEVDNGGETGLIQFPCEATELDGISGFTDQEGDPIYEVGGAGAALGGVGASANHTDTGTLTGRAFGGHVLELSGTKFTEQKMGPQSSAFPQKGGMPKGYLYASGGGFVGPTVNGSGAIINGNDPLGGTLAPGSAVLWPSYPAQSPGVQRGRGEGRIYQRTDWYIRLESVVINVPDGAPIEAADTQDLVEDFSALGLFSDAAPPSEPHTALINPDGVGYLDGAAFALMEGAGDYSRYGPWGGLDSLSPRRDDAYIEFRNTLQDGDTVEVYKNGIALPEIFTAKAVPVGPRDFAVAPQPHVDLAAAIMADAITSPWFSAATAGLTWAGNFAVLLEAQEVVAQGVYVGLRGVTGAGGILLLGTIPFVHGVTTISLLSGGAKILQSSLLHGGAGSVDLNGQHDSLLGMVALGGSVLPAGVVTETILHVP
jgi:hypothetical protein